MTRQTFTAPNISECCFGNTAFLGTIANPDTELDPLEFKARAYILRGIVQLDGEDKPIKLISMQNPVTSLKHKFLRANGTFTLDTTLPRAYSRGLTVRGTKGTYFYSISAAACIRPQLCRGDFLIFFEYTSEIFNVGETDSLCNIGNAHIGLRKKLL